MGAIVVSRFNTLYHQKLCARSEESETMTLHQSPPPYHQQQPPSINSHKLFPIELVTLRILSGCIKNLSPILHILTPIQGYHIDTWSSILRVLFNQAIRSSISLLQSTDPHAWNWLFESPRGSHPSSSPNRVPRPIRPIDDLIGSSTIRSFCQSITPSHGRDACRFECGNRATPEHKSGEDDMKTHASPGCHCVMYWSPRCLVVHCVA